MIEQAAHIYMEPRTPSAAIDGEGEAGEVLLAEDCGDERCEDVLNEGLHDTGEGSANDHGDCQVDHIAASDEVPEPCYDILDGHAVSSIGQPEHPYVLRLLRFVWPTTASKSDLVTKRLLSRLVIADPVRRAPKAVAQANSRGPTR